MNIYNTKCNLHYQPSYSLDVGDYYGIKIANYLGYETSALQRYLLLSWEGLAVSITGTLPLVVYRLEGGGGFEAAPSIDTCLLALMD